MPIITISRQFGSSGAEIAELLRRDLKCDYLDKESLEEKFQEHGLSKENIQRFDERKPGFWDLFKSDKARYLHWLKGVIYETAANGSCIIMGRGGQSLLAGIPGVLHLRLVAPMNIRLERTMQRFECDQDHAEKILLRSDHERAGFHRFFFDHDWEDLSLYDMVINTGSFSAETVTSMIKNAVKTKEFKMARKTAEQKLSDLLLGHKIKTILILEEQIPIQFLEILVEKGEVSLRGIVVDEKDVTRCEEIITAVEGVTQLNNEIFFKPLSINYGMHY